MFVLNNTNKILRFLKRKYGKISDTQYWIISRSLEFHIIVENIYSGTVSVPFESIPYFANTSLKLLYEENGRLSFSLKALASFLRFFPLIHQQFPFFIFFFSVKSKKSRPVIFGVFQSRHCRAFKCTIKVSISQFFNKVRVVFSCRLE